MSDNPLPPDPSSLPIPPQAYISGASALFTQLALQLAPTIFRKVIDEDAIAYLQNYPLKDQAHRASCCSVSESEEHPIKLGVSTREDWYIKLSTATTHVQRVNDPILMIVDDHHLQLDVDLHVNMVSQVYFREYLCCAEWGKIQWCWGGYTVCDNSQLWVDTILNVRIVVEVLNVNNAVVLHPKATLPYPNGVNIDGCKCDLFCATVAKLFDHDTGEIIKSTENRILDKVDQAMQSISAGGIYAPYYGIAIRYSVTSAQLRNNQDVRAYISVVVYALDGHTQQWLIYENHDPERNALYPPFDWPSPELTLPLAGLRVGTNVKSAIAGASEIIGTFQSKGNDVIEDVYLNEDVHWHDVEISIPYRQDQALIQINEVSINMTCQFNRFNCSQSTLESNSSSCDISESEVVINAVPFLVGSITNIHINSTMQMAVVNARPGVYLQATKIDSEALNITIERLPLPLPPSVEQSFMKYTFVRSVSVINPLLLNHPLLLPAEIVPYFPHPSSHRFPQNNSQSGNVGYGYLDIASNELMHSHLQATFAFGIHLLLHESEYDNQNMNCSIAQPGFTMSLYTLPMTS